RAPAACAARGGGGGRRRTRRTGIRRRAASRPGRGPPWRPRLRPRTASARSWAAPGGWAGDGGYPVVRARVGEIAPKSSLHLAVGQIGRLQPRDVAERPELG